MAFPVSSSLLAAGHLARFLQETYSLSALPKCRIIRSGINDNYIVTTEEKKFVFRVYSLDWRTEKEINEEIRLLAKLRDANISVSYALPDKDGKYLQTLDAPEGKRFGVLFSFAEGKKIVHFAPELHFKIGEVMANLHKVVVNQTIDRVTYTPEVLLAGSFECLKEFVPEDSEEMQFMYSAQQFLLKELREANTSELRKGIVHIDIWFDNLNITGDGAITLFDFDFCGNGWLALDPACYLMELQFTEQVESEYRAKAEGFLGGYESVTPLTAEEKRLIPALGACLYFFYLGVQCQRFDNYSNVFLSEANLKRYIIARVKRFMDFHKLGTGAVVSL
jgi:Ser/Thr protein kinase RdoA (MazF antagonist)